MFDSLRARLLLWYALILALAIVTFASTVSYLYWRSVIRGIDRDLQAHASVISGVLSPAHSGGFDLELPAQYRESEFVNRSPHTYYAVWDNRGELVDRSDLDAVLPAVRQPGTRSREGHRETIVDASSGSRILVGRDLDEAHREVSSLATTVGAAGASVLLLSLLGGWFLAGRALAPVARINRAASAMVRGDLSARIAVEETESELEQVALALNEAFDRLRLAADIQRRFTADASHELRTPLTTILAEFDWALSRERPATDYRRTIETCQRAAHRMRRLVNELLTLARDDNRAPMSRHVPVAFGRIVHDGVAALQPLAAQKDVALVLGSTDNVSVNGDSDRLLELVTNLVANAVEYNRPGGRVDVEVRSEDGQACLRVSDTGLGIAAEDVPRVFDRFYRVDMSRSSGAGGAGLGLAIAKSIVDAHHGRISCESEPSRGTTFVARLPLGTADSTLRNGSTVGRAASGVTYR